MLTIAIHASGSLSAIPIYLRPISRPISLAKELRTLVRVNSLRILRWEKYGIFL